MKAAPLLLFALLPVLPLLAEGRSVVFDGYQWDFRRTREPEGPGPNVFLDNPRTIWLSDAGELHLKVWSRNGRWYTSEARLSESLGYGEYEFETRGDLAFTSPNVILGLFLYDHSAPDVYHREIDIEFGRFGDPGHSQGQFAVQPYDARGNSSGFPLPDSPEPDFAPVYTHAFRWSPGRVEFRTVSGSVEGVFGLPADHNRIVAVHVVTGDVVPAPGAETVHVNLWLFQGQPADRDYEVVLSRFAFRPISGAR
jgi:hypothetical protein